MGKMGLVALIAATLFAGCSVNKKIVDTDLSFAIYGTKESSSNKFSHSTLIQHLNVGDETLVEINSNSLYQMVLLAYANELDSFVYFDQPIPKLHPDLETNSITALCLFIGKKNRTWQAEVKYAARTMDSNCFYMEFVEFNTANGNREQNKKRIGVIQLDFNKKEYSICYSNDSNNVERGNVFDLQILYADTMFTDK